MQDIKKKTNSELVALVAAGRATLREERFKEAFSRKAGVIKTAKTEIARALTELSARQSNQSTN